MTEFYTLLLTLPLEAISHVANLPNRADIFSGVFLYSLCKCNPINKIIIN